MRTEQVFSRQVANYPDVLSHVGIDGIEPALKETISYGVCQRHVIVVLCGYSGHFSLNVIEVVGDGPTQRLYIQACPVVFNYSLTKHSAVHKQLLCFMLARFFPESASSPDTAQFICLR